MAKINEWFSKLFGRGDKTSLTDPGLTCEEMRALVMEWNTRELAFWSAVNLVAKAIGKCEFKTYMNHKETKGPEYYLWNYEPNVNQNSTVFLHKLVAQLYEHNEALVVEARGQLFVADSFNRAGNVVKPDVFTEVMVDNLVFKKQFRQEDVLHFRLSHVNMRPLLNGIAESFKNLLNAAVSDYRWKAGRHATLDINALQAGGGDWQVKYAEILNNYMTPFMQSDNGVLPVFNGMEFEELGGGAGRVQTTTRDVRSLVDDVFDFTGQAFYIPPVLLKGDVQNASDAVQRLLTFGIDPLADMLQEEIVRKRYGLEGYLAGNFLQVDTSTINHFDLFGNATHVDKLISSGAYSINDVRIAAGDSPIDEPWANEHFITKNYETVLNMTRMEGGESNQTVSSSNG